MRTGTRSPNKVDVHKLGGIGARFEYYNAKKDVRVIPDEDDLAAATCYDVLYFWNAVANWAVRFVAANHGWTINGAPPVETLEEDD
jgi:hypothetical protein